MKQRRFVIRHWTDPDKPLIRVIERMSFTDPMDAQQLDQCEKWVIKVVDHVEFGAIAFAIWTNVKSSCKVLRFAVHPDFRRFGYGRHLLQDCIDVAERKELTVRCDISSRNLGGALFLKAMGMQGTSTSEAVYRFQTVRQFVKKA